MSALSTKDDKKIHVRKYWIDALRGMAMLFVIFGHQCSEWTSFFVFTSAIKVSLFFVISGYLFNERNGDVISFLKNLFFKLIIPYFFLSLLPMRLLYGIIRGATIGVFGKYIYNFLCGTLIWYMPCCIIAEIIQFFIRKFCKKRFIRNFVFLMFTIIGLILGRYEIGNFAFVNTACTAQGFLAIGCLIKENEVQIYKNHKLFIILGSAIYIALAVLSLVLFPGEAMNIKRNIYYSYSICALMILTGSVVCFIGARKIDERWGIKKNSLLVFVGQNTLVFYILHHYVKRVFTICLKILHIVLLPGPMYWVSNTIAICVGCSIIAVLINHYFPFLVGKK